MYPARIQILCFVLGTQSLLIQGNEIKHSPINSNKKKLNLFFFQYIIIFILFTDTYRLILFCETKKWYIYENKKAIGI